MNSRFIRGEKADDPDGGLHHNIEPLWPEWVGQCVNCHAVHVRRMPRLVDHGDDEREYTEYVGGYGARRGYVAKHMGDRMIRECSQPIEQDVPDYNRRSWEGYGTKREYTPCTGYVFEVPDQAALLAAFAVGGAEAVIAMCMVPDRARSLGERICLEEAARNRRR